MKNRVQENEITTVCCVCGHHLGGPWPAVRQVSHSYCPQHYQMAMLQIKAYFAILDRSQAAAPRSVAA